MTRQGRLRLSLTLGAGCLLAAAWLAAGLSSTPVPGGAHGGPGVQPRLDVAGLQLPPLDAFPETTRRPLFSTTRSPAVARAATGPEGLILGRYAFVGAVVTQDRRLVLLRPAAGGDMLRLQEGDALDSWRIEKIAADLLTLRDGERVQNVQLRKAPQ